MVRPIPGSMELERGRSKEGRDNKGTVYKVWKKKCNRRKSVRIRKEGDSVPRMQDRKEETIVELGSGSAPHRGKSTAEQHVDRDSKKYSNRGDWSKGCQENVQNVERGVVEYWSRKSRYT